MIEYNPENPLIFIHVPKCAGTSARMVLQDWFGKGFHRHYQGPETRGFPAIVDFTAEPHNIPQVVYGHFSSEIDLGIQDRYPDVDQFITILRDPLDAVVSEYFYHLGRIKPLHKKTPREIAKWVVLGGLRVRSRVATKAYRKRILAYSGVEDYVRINGSKFLNHFPVEITAANYVDVIENMFVEIGVIEHLEDSLRRIARALGKPDADIHVPHLNKSRRDQGISPEAEAEFRENNALTFKVYDYVRAKFEPKTEPGSLMASQL